MKHWKMCLLICCFVAFFGGNCWGSTTGYSDKILLVNTLGESSPDSTVTFNITFFEISPIYASNVFSLNSWTIGEMVNNTFVPFNSLTQTRNGGDLLDLAIQSSDRATTLCLSDANANVVFFSDLYNGSDAAENPSWVTKWYDVVNIGWDSNVGPTWAMGVTNLNAIGSDGFAPVPIPATAFLLSTGVLGLVGIRRRFMN